ncbi:hypothetical protein Hanom_Chr16g01449381 [Helianthus anomalus]
MYVKPMSLFQSVCSIKLVIFTYNLPESDLKPEIEQELICANDTQIYTNPKYEIQYFIGFVTSVLVNIVNSSVINEIKLFDPYICFFMFDVFHVLTFIRFQTLYRFLENYTQTDA